MILILSYVFLLPVICIAYLFLNNGQDYITTSIGSIKSLVLLTNKKKPKLARFGFFGFVTFPFSFIATSPSTFL